MKQPKRLLSLILSSALSFALLIPVQSFALSATGNDYSRAKETILKSILEKSSTANISNIKIPEENAGDLYFDFIDEYPELYYAYCPYYSYLPEQKIVTKYAIRYYDCDDQAFDKAVMRAKTLAVKPEMNDLEKALSLHDYIISICEYDTEAAMRGEPSISDTAYGALVNGKAICQGYSLAYNLLLRQCGIEAHMINSDTMNHSWNIVKIDDKWYHVDCTWDDPVFEDEYKDENYVDHIFFMLSDAAMLVAGPADPASSADYSDPNWQDIRHSGWQTTVKCDDDCYDDGGTWKDLTCPAFPIRLSGQFEDVPDDAYYFDAVEWAVDNGVTSGVSETCFEPQSTCTRGQVVAFLWRALGKPEPKTMTNPFKDVNESSYYFKAVLWASENGIVYGISETEFAPAMTCTNAQVLAFLWRALGRPAAENKNAADNTGSDNIQSVDTETLAQKYSGTYYEEALKWAEPCGLLDNTDCIFTPSEPSPRANIVTYLYRVFNE